MFANSQLSSIRLSPEPGLGILVSKHSKEAVPHQGWSVHLPGPEAFILVAQGLIIIHENHLAVVGFPGKQMLRLFLLFIC